MVFEGDHLLVELLNTPVNAEKESFIREYLSHWLDLAHDLTPFYQMAMNDPILKSFVPQLKGLRLIGVNNLFEALGWAVLGQQVNLGFAYEMKKRLIETYGEKKEIDGRLYHLYPQASQIAKLETGVLRPLQISRQKESYLIGIAKEMAEGKLSKAELKDMTYEGAKERLIQMKGVGAWTADYVLMRCLRFTEALPAMDAGLLNAIKYWLNMDRKPTKEEVYELFEAWHPWEAYATFYFWGSFKLMDKKA